MIKKKNIYFENLDSIRFIAALMVFLGHSIKGSTNDYSFVKNSYLLRLLNLMSSGATGVSIFFVLSGFLITYLLISEYELTSGVSIRNFYVRRILRIWPLYFAVVFFAFFIYPTIKSLIGMNNERASKVIYQFLFLSNFDLIRVLKFSPGQESLSQTITWSVSIEEQFYLFWPLIFTFLPKKTWIYTVVALIAGSFLFRLYHYTDEIVLYMHSLSALGDLATGGLLAYLVKEYKRIGAFFENTTTFGHFIYLSFAFFVNYSGPQIAAHFTYGVVYIRPIMAISFALVICAQALTAKNSVLNLKNLSFANTWGKYTYGIYLIHPIALIITDVSSRLIHLPKNNLAVTLIITILTFALALWMSKMSYTYFESWFLRLKDKFAVIKEHPTQHHSTS